MIWSEGNICEKLLGYILVIFVAISLVFISCMILIGLVYTFDSTIDLCLHYSDTNINM